MPTDPIAAVVTALTDPTTGLFTLPPGGQPAAPGALYNDIYPFVNAIFSATSDLTAVSKQINSALTEAATVVGTIGTAMQAASGTNLADVSAAMTALQGALSLAQSLAPAGTAAVLTSGSNLFQEIESQLSGLAAGSTLNQAATELAELALLLTGLANMFPH
jgi:hypothetical protein